MGQVKRISISLVTLAVIGCGTSKGPDFKPSQTDSRRDDEVESVCGWNVNNGPYVTLQGIATRMSYADGIFGDDDWSLFVQPDPLYSYLLFNRYGQRNADGQVECEVQAPDRVLGVAYNNPAAMERYFRPLLGKHVTVVGTWAEEAGNCHNNKTEIHPIVSIFQTDDPNAGPSYFMQFLVFSNSSSFDLIVRPHLPPYNRQNNEASFFAPIPPPPQGGDPLRYTILNETNAARRRDYSVIPGTPNVLAGSFESGTADEGKGFYFAKILVGNCTPSSCAGLCGWQYDGCGAAQYCGDCPYCYPDCGPWPDCYPCPPCCDSCGCHPCTDPACPI